MKRHLLLLTATYLTALIAFTGTPSAATGGGLVPDIVPTEYHTAYLPVGFDTNDHVQIVTEGIFTSTCYKPARPEVLIDRAKKTIHIRPRAYYYDGFCLQVLVPYDQVLDLGLLEGGTYKVVQEGEETPYLGELGVRAAVSPTADDYLYAPISQAFFRATNGKREVTLAGEFTNSCLNLSNVIVNVQPRVVTIQPVAEFKDGSDCVSGKFPFERTIELKDVKAGRYLLHVRSMNGKAINTLVDVP